jgi:non-lysosomal glucosylceramidase
MSGWFRTFTRDFAGTPNQGNHNNFMSEKLAATEP